MESPLFTLLNSSKLNCRNINGKIYLQFINPSTGFPTTNMLIGDQYVDNYSISICDACKALSRFTYSAGGCASNRVCDICNVDYLRIMNKYKAIGDWLNNHLLFDATTNNYHTNLPVLTKAIMVLHTDLYSLYWTLVNELVNKDVSMVIFEIFINLVPYKHALDV